MRTRIEVPPRTIITILLVGTMLWLFGRLWNQVLLFIIAVLLAAALDPAVTRLERRGWSRSKAVVSLLVLFVAVFALLITFIVPRVVEQGTRLINNLPGYVDDLQGVLEPYPAVLQWLEETSAEVAADPASIFGNVLSFGTGVATGISNLFILMAMTIYLLLDGSRLFAWLVEIIPPSHKGRAERTGREISHVVGGYLRGQGILSTCFRVFAFVTLTVAGAPEPMLLAVLAAFLDAIPLVGATIATIPAVLIALTVSPTSALVVLVLFIAYQQVENYVIQPRVFHGALNISALAVLIAVTVGATLLGVVGAILALPVAAAIPAIARIWREDGRSVPRGGVRRVMRPR